MCVVLCVRLGCFRLGFSVVTGHSCPSSLVTINQTGAVLYFAAPIDALGTLVAPNGELGRPQFLEAWKSVNGSLELAKEVRFLDPSLG